MTPASPARFVPSLVLQGVSSIFPALDLSITADRSIPDQWALFAHQIDRGELQSLKKLKLSVPDDYQDLVVKGIPFRIKGEMSHSA